MSKQPPTIDSVLKQLQESIQVCKETYRLAQEWQNKYNEATESLEHAKQIINTGNELVTEYKALVNLLTTENEFLWQTLNKIATPSECESIMQELKDILNRKD